MSDPRPHLFHAVLYPHRSLSRQGFWILMGAIILIMGYAASRALSLGAWPVAVFLIRWGCGIRAAPADGREARNGA